MIERIADFIAASQDDRRLIWSELRHVDAFVRRKPDCEAVLALWVLRCFVEVLPPQKGAVLLFETEWQDHSGVHVPRSLDELAEQARAPAEIVVFPISRAGEVELLLESMSATTEIDPGLLLDEPSRSLAPSLVCRFAEVRIPDPFEVLYRGYVIFVYPRRVLRAGPASG
jgi:hypothetical protein